MSTLAFDRLISGGAFQFDRLVDLSGVPVITAISAVIDGSSFTITGTGFSASGNSVFVTQGDALLPVPITAEGTTSITTDLLDTNSIYITQPIGIYVTNNASVASNSVVANIQAAAGSLAFALTQSFLGDASSRLAASPDCIITDEWRIRNIVGGTTSDFTFTGQGALKVAAGVTACDAAIQDGTGLSDFVTQTFADPPASAIVPDVTNKTLNDATLQLRGAGFIVSVVANAQDSLIPFGNVLTQFPLNPSSLVLGGTVELTLSLGLTGTLVPQLIGVTKTGAELARQAAGLVGASLIYVDGQNSGNVLNQSVDPGTPVLIGSSVDIVYSSGLLPDFSGQLIQNATASILSSNLTVSQSSITTPGGRANTVSSQLPAPNSPVNPGDAIQLNVFSGLGGSGFLGVSGDGVSGPGVSNGTGVSGPGVSLTSTNTAGSRILTEGGDSLVTESGDHLITES